MALLAVLLVFLARRFTMQSNHDFYRIKKLKGAQVAQIRTTPVGTIRKQLQTFAGILKTAPLFAVLVK